MVQRVEEYAEALSAAVRDLNQDDRRLAVALFKRLADGEPVAPARLAADTGLAGEHIEAWLQSGRVAPGVFRDGDGRVVGFWGLATPPMAHRFRAEGGKPMYAWCAIDPLLIVPVIGRSARVESSDPVTGEPIAMTVTPSGVRDVVPESAVMTFRVPTGPLTEDVIATFCDFVRNFASEETARQWIAGRGDASLVVLSVDDAAEVGRRAWRTLRNEESRRMKDELEASPAGTTSAEVDETSGAPPSGSC